MFLGIIKGWKEKVYYFIIMGSVIFVVISGFVVGVNNLSGDLKWYQFLYNIFWMIVGSSIGENFLEEIKEK